MSKKYPFIFDKDYPEEPESGQSPSPDLGVIHQEGIPIETKDYADDESFFSIEAKILGLKNKQREKEYVVGATKASGGIERFKKCIHGKDLNYGGMLGYVQKHNFDYWHNAVNLWINERINADATLWNENDKLVAKDATSITAKYESENLRITNDNIKLFHLWVLLHNSPN